MAPGPWYQEEGHLAEQCLTPEACGDIRPILEELSENDRQKPKKCRHTNSFLNALNHL